MLDFEDFDQSTDHEAGNVRYYRTASYGRADRPELLTARELDLTISMMDLIVDFQMKI